MRVLWLDDEPIFLDTVGNNLRQKLNCTIDWASTLECAVKKLEASEFDLVILDVVVDYGYISTSRSYLGCLRWTLPFLYYFKRLDPDGFEGGVWLYQQIRRERLEHDPQVPIIFCSAAIQMAKKIMVHDDRSTYFFDKKELGDGKKLVSFLLEKFPNQFSSD